MERTSVVEGQITSALNEVASVTHADSELIERLIRNAQDGHIPANTERRRTVWMKPLLAAAVVAAVAAGAAVLVNLPDHHMPPSTTTSSVPPPSASQSPSPSPTSTAPQVNGPFQPLTCTVASPSSWDGAQSPVRPPGAASTDETSGLSIMGVSANGTVLTSSDIGGPNGEVVLVQPDQSTRVLYRLPGSLAGQNTLRLSSGQLDGSWAVFDVILGGGQGAVGAIDAVNLATGSLQVVRDASQGTDLILSAPQLLDGHVYWSEVSNTGQGSIYDYDLVAGKRSTLDTGSVEGPQVVGGAVEWTRDGKLVWHGSPTLPPGFQITSGKTGTLLQDGSTYAWTAWTGTGAAQKEVIYMAKSGMAKPEIVYTPPSADITPTLLALSGPYVIFDNTYITVLDTRTGAATTLTSSQPPLTTAAAADGIIALNTVGSKGGAQLTLIKTNALSELHC